MKKRTGKNPVIGTYTADIGGHEMDYTVKRSRRSRFARLEYRMDEGLSVVIPVHYSLSNVQRLLLEKRSWILKQITRKQHQSNKHELKNLLFGADLPFMGRYITLAKSSDGISSGSVSIDEDRIIVNCSENDLAIVLEKWYRQQALLTLKSRVDETCKLLDVSYKRLTIRDQRTRWGSCSRQGTLSFNWRLIMFSDIIIDYVILHEAAHLREMNHSAGFWKIVEKYCPYYKVHRKWLRVYGQQLAHSFKI